MIISLDKSINFECDWLEVIEKISQKKKEFEHSQSVKTDTICSRLKELSAGQSNGGAGQQSKEIVGSYTEASTSTVTSSLADKDRAPMGLQGCTRNQWGNALPWSVHILFWKLWYTWLVIIRLSDRKSVV